MKTAEQAKWKKRVMLMLGIMFGFSPELLACEGAASNFTALKQSRSVFLIGANISGDPKKYPRIGIKVSPVAYSAQIGVGYLAFRDTEHGYIATADHVIGTICSGLLDGVDTKIQVIRPTAEDPTKNFMYVAQAEIVTNHPKLCAKNEIKGSVNRDVGLLKIKLADLAQYPDVDLEPLPISLFVDPLDGFQYSAVGYIPGSIQPLPFKLGGINKYIDRTRSKIVPGIWTLTANAYFGYSGSPVVAVHNNSFIVVGLVTQLYRDQEHFVREVAELDDNQAYLTLTRSSLHEHIVSSVQVAKDAMELARFTDLQPLGRMLPPEYDQKNVNLIMRLLTGEPTLDNRNRILQIASSLTSWEQAAFMNKLKSLSADQRSVEFLMLLMELHRGTSKWCWYDNSFTAEIVRLSGKFKNAIVTQAVVEHGQEMLRLAWRQKGNAPRQVTLALLDFSAQTLALGSSGYKLSNIYRQDEAIARIRLNDLSPGLKTQEAAEAAIARALETSTDPTFMKSAGDFKMKVVERNMLGTVNSQIYDGAMQTYLRGLEGPKAVDSSTNLSREKLIDSYTNGINVGERLKLPQAHEFKQLGIQKGLVGAGRQ